MALSAYNQNTKQFMNGVALEDTDLNAFASDVSSAPVALSRLPQSGAQIGQVIGWTGSGYGPITITTGGGSTVNLGSATPLVDGFPGPGTSTNAAREDHVHPTDNSRYAASNPLQFQSAAQVTAAISAALAGVSGGGTPSSSTPLVDSGTGSAGTATNYARGDHFHPVDTSRYAASNPLQFQTATQVTASINTAVAGIGAAAEPTPKVITSSPYTVLSTDRYLLIKLIFPGICTVNVESSPAANRGLLWIKNHIANGATATVASSGPAIEGGSSISIAPGGSETLMYVAGEYQIV